MKFTLCKKQYIYIALAVLSLALAITTRVFAQDAMPAIRGDEYAPPNGAPGNQGTTSREERQAAREERRGVLEQRIQDRIVNLTRNVVGRMEAAISRMEQITSRLDTRIGILKEKGVNTTSAEGLLAVTKRAIQDARDSLSSLDDEVVTAISSDRPREAFKEVRIKILAARLSLRQAHAGFIQVVAMLKEAVRNAETGTGVSDAVQNPQSLKAATSSAEEN